MGAKGAAECTKTVRHARSTAGPCATIPNVEIVNVRHPRPSPTTTSRGDATAATRSSRARPGGSTSSTSSPPSARLVDLRPGDQPRTVRVPPRPGPRPALDGPRATCSAVTARSARSCGRPHSGRRRRRGPVGPLRRHPSRRARVRARLRPWPLRFRWERPVGRWRGTAPPTRPGALAMGADRAGGRLTGVLPPYSGGAGNASGRADCAPFRCRRAAERFPHLARRRGPRRPRPTQISDPRLPTVAVPPSRPRRTPPPGPWSRRAPARRRPRHAPPLGRRRPDPGLDHAGRPSPVRPADRAPPEAAAPGRGAPLASMGASTDDSRRVPPALRHGRCRTTTSAAAVPARRARARSATRGRRPLETLIAYLDASRTRRPRRGRGAGRGVVEDQAVRLAAAGASLTESVALFVTPAGRSSPSSARSPPSSLPPIASARCTRMPRRCWTAYSSGLSPPTREAWMPITSRCSSDADRDPRARLPDALLDQWRERRTAFQLIWAIGMLLLRIAAGGGGYRRAPAGTRRCTGRGTCRARSGPPAWLGLGTAFLLAGPGSATRTPSCCCSRARSR